MRVVHPRRRPPHRPVGIVLLVLLIALAALGGTALVPSPASADGTDVVTMPDANLKAAMNKAIATATGTTRTATQDITVADAAQVKVVSNQVTGPVADLTGLEAFTGLTQFTDSVLTGNTYTSVAPLAHLTSLTSLTLAGGQITDITPLAGLTNLTQLSLNRIATQRTDPSFTSVAALSGLTKLTNLNLANNQITSLAGFPTSVHMTTLSLAGNKIKDVTPLAGAFDQNTLTTLNLSNNRITDASALAPLGANGAPLGASTSQSTGLVLTGNRIKDFSPFSGWLNPISSKSKTQSVYVGPYQSGGITLTLKDSDATIVPAIDASLGSYDATSGTLTVVDPAAASVVVSPDWTVYFSNPPIDPGDDNGPQIGVSDFTAPTTFVALSGAPTVTETLEVTDPGNTLDATSCSAYSYQWLRDGDDIAGTPYAWADGDYASPYQFRTYGYRGDRADYMVAAQDVGHQLSVRITCDATGQSSTSRPTAVVAGHDAQTPVVADLRSITSFSKTDGEPVVYQLAGASGVVGDPTNPTVGVYVGQLGSDGALVDPTGIQVALTAVTTGDHADTTAVTPNDVSVTGTGAERTIAIAPERPTMGWLVLQFTVTGPTGTSIEVDLPYAASVATTPTSRELVGMGDASSAVDVGDGYFLAADDESSYIRLYDGEVSGREVAQFWPGTGLFGGSGELDFESSARKGDEIWWLGSHGNDRDHKTQPSRQQIFETTLTGSGAQATLTPTGQVYAGLRDDLIAWDHNHNDRFGFDVGTQEHSGINKDDVNGFDIEGAEFSPDGSELYLGFRAPLSTGQVGGKALIVPLTNLEALTSGAADKALFGDPILLDLGGDSIREIRKNAAGEYLILSAPAGTYAEPRAQSLWAWDGEPADAPRKLTTQLPLDVEPTYSDNAGAWEGIADMPDRLAPGAQIRLLMDQGYDDLYSASGGDNKDDINGFATKSRTDVVTLAGAAGTIAQLSDPGDFGYQAATTLGTAREVTVTNAGSNVLHLGSVSVADDDGVSADDFLISTNGCTGQTLALDASCTIRVRYAPSRTDADSTARLVVASDVPGGATSVPLTGTSRLATLSATAPVVDGTAKVGATLTARAGDWGDGVTYAYQWLRNGVAIDGASTATYAATAADVGQQLAVKVTGTKPGFATATQTSAAVTIAEGDLSPVTPTVTGTARVGSTLTVSAGSWGDGVTLAYQWLRGGVPIGGATASSYALVPADGGRQVSVTVTGTKPGYATASVTSAAATVSLATLSAGTPTMTGTAKVALRLTARAGTWTAGTTLTYQWTRGGAAIRGATGSSYPLVAADAGTRVAVRVTGAKAGYATVTRTSAARTVAKGTLRAPKPRITGTATVGRRLTAASGSWPPGTRLTYRWLANGVVIKGATARTLRLTAALAGRRISVKVTGTKAGYATVAKASVSTRRVSR